MKVVIMRGVSGSGKSSYVEEILADFSATRRQAKVLVCSADQYFLDGTEYRFDPKLLGKAHAWCLRKFNDAVSPAVEKYDLVVVDNTNTTPTEMAPYIALATAYNHDVEIVLCEAHPGIACQRNVHGVPNHTVFSQWDRLVNSPLPPFWPKQKKVFTSDSVGPELDEL